MENEMRTEKLLDAWLKLSSVVANNRLVEDLSFNEAFVLNLLYKQQCSGQERKLTATDLCRQTHTLKSQMNAILTSLEKKQLIQRQRSNEDRRQIEVAIHSEGMDTFLKCHAHSLQLVEGVLEKVGAEQGDQAVLILNQLADAFEELLEHAQKKNRS